jgi:GlcNAc-P-P-Und epimerase
VRRCLGRDDALPTIPRFLAMAGGYLFDAIARLTRQTLPISSIRVRKFCESTQFIADRVHKSGFQAPFTLQEGLARTIDSEFGAAQAPHLAITKKLD